MNSLQSAVQLCAKWTQLAREECQRLGFEPREHSLVSFELNLWGKRSLMVTVPLLGCLKSDLSGLTTPLFETVLLGTGQREVAQFATLDGLCEEIVRLANPPLL